MSGLALRVIVGLGNPGPEHLVTRHNAGFWFVDLLARRHGGEFRDYRKYSGETARITLSEREIILLKPTTYMNRSGLSVRQVSDFYKIAPEEILVAHDELDLPVGSVRLKQGGGHGGHNGLRSIIDQCGGNGFARVRVGVGKPPMHVPGKDVSGWVLGDFPPGQAALVDGIVARSADAVEAVVGLGVTPAMNDFNGKPPVT